MPDSKPNSIAIIDEVENAESVVLPQETEPLHPKDVLDQQSEQEQFVDGDQIKKDREEAERTQADNDAEKRQKAEKAMGFLGPLNKWGQRQWKAPDEVNGHPCSGNVYTFSLPNATHYAQYVKGGISSLTDDFTGLDFLLQIPDYCSVVGSETGAVNFDNINMFELERLRWAFIYFLFRS